MKSILSDEQKDNLQNMMQEMMQQGGMMKGGMQQGSMVNQ